MADSSPAHLYHVYKIMDQQNNRHDYVSEGSGTLSHDNEFIGPLITADLAHLSKATVRDHLNYLQEQGFTHVSKENDLYMAFSFTPTCQRIMQYGRIYSTHSLNGNEQSQFCDGVKEVYKTLDDLIDFERTGNPLE